MALHYRSIVLRFGMLRRSDFGINVPRRVKAVIVIHRLEMESEEGKHTRGDMYFTEKRALSTAHSRKGDCQSPVS